CDKNVEVKRVEMCNDAVNYPSKFFTSLTTRNGIQYLTSNLTLSEELGDNVLVFTEVFIDSPGVGKVRLGAANGTFCKITRKYIGPFLHDLEKAAQILPGICPIPKGKYQITDFPINISNMFLKGLLPSGRLTFVGRYTKLRTGQVLMCYEIEIEVS
ncbi:unnamed protein product, partial [Tenebrio molitor]